MKYKKGDELKSSNLKIVILDVNDGYYHGIMERGVYHWTDKELDEIGCKKVEKEAPPEGTVVSVNNGKAIRFSAGRFDIDGHLLCYIDGFISGTVRSYKNWEIYA